MAFYSLMPLGPALAAEVLGIDLAAPLDADMAEALAAALAAHLVLVFRNQSLSRAQYLGVAAALQLPSATLLYRAEATSELPGDTDIANLRVACDELPEAEQGRLRGMPLDEVKGYLGEAILETPEAVFLYRHAWQQGDVLLIDDRGTIHRDTGEAGALWRIIAEGDHPRFG